MRYPMICLIAMLVVFTTAISAQDTGVPNEVRNAVKTDEQAVTLPTKVKQKHILHADTNVHTHDITHHHHANNAHHHSTDLHHYTYYNHNYNHVVLNRHYAPRTVNHSGHDNHFKFDKSWNQGKGGSKRCVNGVWQ